MNTSTSTSARVKPERTVNLGPIIPGSPIPLLSMTFITRGPKQTKEEHFAYGLGLHAAHPVEANEDDPPQGRPRSPFLTRRRRVRQSARPERARSRLKAVLISARCVKACGKLPRASPLGPVCSAYSPTWLP